MLQYFETLTDDSGNSLLGATVTVTNYPSGSLASIFNTNGTGSPVANSTVVADITGQISFYAEDGAYTLTYAYKSTVYKTKSPVQMLDPLGFVAVTDTGAANAYVLTNAALPASLYVGLKVEFNAATANTGPSTLNVNATGNLPLNMPGGGGLTAGQILTGGLYRAEWDGAQWQLTQASGSGAQSGTLFVSVFQYGAKGDGVTNDSAAINAALAAVGAATGTFTMKLVFMPKPSVNYLVNTAIVSAPGVALVYNPEDINPASTQFSTLPLTNQISIEGTPPLQYKSAMAYAITVDPANGGLAAPYRYWTLIGSVSVPAQAIPAGIVTADSVGVRGQAISNALNARVWGVVGVAQANQAAVNDTQVGSVIGGEFDVNNDTTMAYVDYDRNVNITSLQVACGGTNNAMSAIDMQVNPIVGPFNFTGNGVLTAFGPLTATTSSNSTAYTVTVGGVYVLPSAYTVVAGGNITFAAAPANGAAIIVTQGTQFICGIVSKQSSIGYYGWYLDNVAPIRGVLFISDAYGATGGPAVNVKNGVDALYLRNAASTDFVGRIRADTAAMEIIGGPGTGSGTPGIYFVNHANAVINAELTDAGSFQALNIGHKPGNKTVNATTIPVGGVGQITCSDSGATSVTAFTGGELGGRKLTLLFTTGNTTIKAAVGHLKGGIDATPSANSSMTFEMDNAAVWWETGRSF